MVKSRGKRLGRVFAEFVLIVVGVRQWLKSEEGKAQWDDMKMRLPIFGTILKSLYLARLTENLAQHSLQRPRPAGLGLGRQGQVSLADRAKSRRLIRSGSLEPSCITSVAPGIQGTAPRRAPPTLGRKARGWSG